MLSVRAFSVLAVTMLFAACAKEPEPQPAQPAEPVAEQKVASENVFQFTIGELTAFALKDGGFVFPNDTKIVGVGRSPEEVAKLLEGAGAPTNELSLSIQPLLVRSDDQVLLFDTGGGAGETTGKLLSSMNEAGIAPSSVTDIFISHAHGDHVGGLLDGNGALTFENATVHMSAPEWDAVQASATDDDSRAALVKAIAPKIETFAPGAEIIPGLVKGVDIKGHTPGHSGYLISSGEQTLLYIGDSAHHYIVSVQEPEWTIQFDRDAPTAQASRKELIASNAQSGQRIYAVHFPFPGIGKFVAEGERFVWRPEQ